MVASLGALRDEPDGAADISCGVLEEPPELFGGQMVRAGAGDQAASGAEKPHRAQVDFLVARDGFGQTGSRFHEGGRIEDDQVEELAAAIPLLELVEDVADAVGTAIGQAVLFGQGLRPCDGRRRLIEARHAGCPVSGGMEPPEARIAEAIQDFRPLRQPFDQAIVLDLVQEQARFLAFQKVHRHVQAVHLNDEFRQQFSEEDTPFPGKAFAFAHRRIVAGHNGPRLKDLRESLEYEIPAAIHPGGQNLDHQCVAVAIHDQPGQPISFRVNHTVGGPGKGRVLARLGWAGAKVAQHLFPPGLGLSDAVGEEILIDGDTIPPEETDGDAGARIEVAAPEEAPPAVKDVN